MNTCFLNPAPKLMPLDELNVSAMLNKQFFNSTTELQGMHFSRLHLCKLGYVKLLH